MAGIVLVAAFVSVYSGMFLTCVFMACVAERECYPLTAPVAHPARQRQTAPPVGLVFTVTGTPRAFVPHVAH